MKEFPQTDGGELTTTSIVQTDRDGSVRADQVCIVLSRSLLSCNMT